MNGKSNADFVRDAVHELVLRQLQEDEPAATRLHLARLTGLGYTRAEALTLLGCALSREMFHALDRGCSFDPVQYCAALERLPALPWNEE